MVQKMPTFIKANIRLGSETRCPHFSKNASLIISYSISCLLKGRCRNADNLLNRLLSDLVAQ